ncbi:MAG: hypothetical protein AAB481_04820 [Patescibacteria group bacterium]
MNIAYFSSGDGPFYYSEQMKALSWLPPIWEAFKGFGENLLPRLWIDYPFRLLVKLLSSVGLSWFVIEKLLWISVFVLAIYSSKKLADYVLGKNMFTWAAPVVYVANTYILLLFGGGQLGVALAYGFAPLVLLKFIQAVDGLRATGYGLKQGIRNGLFFALLVTFDLRFAYLSLLMSCLYAAFRRRLPLFSWVISFLTAGFIHAFWILPILLAGGGTGGLGEEFTSTGMLQFLSVADFSHALSLLHPNWPENLFGKVYFMQPEFLVIPLLAFASLLIKEGQEAINNKQQKRLLFTVYCPFFALLALVGAFLAKGVNEPFGGIYAWMFTHVPGFVMFRDPTKFYFFVALGYSILIPFALEHIKKKVMFIVFIVFWLFTLRAVFTAQVTGNLRPTQLPQEYVQLKDLLVADSTPSRTLWIPQKENYAFASATHPFLATESAFVEDPLFIQKISQMGVRYVIVPPDVYKRLFLTDYRFDPKQRTDLIEALGKTSLQRNSAFGDIAVFENDRFVFEQSTPPGIVRQQELANIGLVFSIVFLIVCIAVLIIV